LDSQGEITRVTYQDGAYWNYAYDGRYRLTSAARKNSGGTTLQSHAYVYNAGDNLVSKTVAGTTTVFGYNTANELTTQTVGGTTTTFTYDDWGRTVTKTQGSYQATYYYRFGNKLKAAVSNFPGEPTPVQPNYDGFGRLRSVGINNGAIVWRYRWAGNQMLSEYDDTDGTWEIEDSKLIYTYVHDPAMVAGAPLADLAGTNPSTGTARYYFGDNLGSTRRLRNASKTSLGSYEYKPYGEMYAETGATAKYKFAGMYYSPDLGVYYTLNRLYNPTLARWTTRDPLGMVDGANLYAYALNNPALFIDPFGLTWWDPWDWDVPGPYGSPYPSEWGLWNSILDGPQQGTRWGTAQNVAVWVAVGATLIAISLIAVEGTTAIRIELHGTHGWTFPHLQGIKGPGWGRTLWRFPPHSWTPAWWTSFLESLSEGEGGCP
jgi:RHS repeat-associated protein